MMGIYIYLWQKAMERGQGSCFHWSYSCLEYLVQYSIYQSFDFLSGSELPWCYHSKLQISFTYLTESTIIQIMVRAQRTTQ